MATLIWRGDAQGTAQVTNVTFTGVASGMVFTLKINNKSVSVTATDALKSTLVGLFLTAIDNAQAAGTHPEWEDVTAAAGTDDGGNTTFLKLTGPSDGKPFTVTSSTSTTSDLSMHVSTLQDGSADVNRKVIMSLPEAVSGGTFTITVKTDDGNATTAATAYNATAATIDTNLEALSNVGVGDVTVSGNAGGPWTIEFTGNYAGTAGNDVVLTTNGGSLTGTHRAQVTKTQTGGYTNETYTLTSTGSTGDSWTLSVTTIHGTAVTAPIFNNATGADIQTELERLTNIQPGDINVTGDAGGPWTFEWIGANAGQAIADAIEAGTYWRYGVSATPGTYLTFANTVDGGTNQEHKQTIIFPDMPNGGSWTFDFLGSTSGSISWAAAATMATSLDTEITTIISGTSGEVTVVGTDLIDPAYTTGTAVKLEITIAKAGATSEYRDYPLLSVNTGSLTSFPAFLEEEQAGEDGQNEVQQVRIEGTAGGGTFTLANDFGGGTETTSGIAYNASASTVQTALEALTTPVSGDFRVTGNAGGPWIIEYTGNFAETGYAAFTADGSSLTGGSGSHTITLTAATAATGPNWVNNADNWSTGAVPVSTDTVIFTDNAVDALYGLDQLSAVTLTQLTIRKSYTGRIGLPAYNTNGYYEYLPTYFAIGATNILIGEGDGSGPTRLKINTGSVQTAVLVQDTGFSEDDQPAAVWKGTHASNVVRIVRGDFGIATDGGDAATVATLQMGYVTNVEDDANVRIGSGATLTTITKTGGVLESAAGATTVTQTGGSAVLEGSITTLNVDVGECEYVGTGTITTLNVGAAGDMSFDRDTRSRTVTNSTIVGGATLSDRFQSVTWTNPITLSRCGLEDVELSLGTHITIDVAAA